MKDKKMSAAIIGSGNIGSDLMMKVMRYGEKVFMGALVGIDASSEGLARARRMGIPTTHEGVEGLTRLPNFKEIKLVFDATSAGAHKHNNAILQEHGICVIDLTPAAIGPYVVPVVNLKQHIREKNINMVTCGGQATIPIVAAISRVAEVHYAEIVASISSKSAGPGTRANIDEFTETTSIALRRVGGAKRSKAIIILNPAEPPMLMRDTVFCLTNQIDETVIDKAIRDQVAAVQKYVPGYCLKQDVQFEKIDQGQARFYPDLNGQPGLKVSVFLQVEGAAHYLPTYAGNLDIMTSAALACAEEVASVISGDTV